MLTAQPGYTSWDDLQTCAHAGRARVMPVPKRSGVPRDRCSLHCSFHAVYVPGCRARFHCKTVISRHLKGRFCLCCRAMGTPPTSDGRMVRSLPGCQTRTSCVNWEMLRRWIVQHMRRQHRCVAQTPPGTACAQSGCQRCQPCMMLPALHLHCQPCGSCPSHQAQLPACRGEPLHPIASWTCPGAISLDIAQVPPGSMTDALAAVPTCLWLCALPYLQHLTMK